MEQSKTTADPGKVTVEQGKVITSRRAKLEKTHQMIFALIGISSFIVIFSIVISKALISQIGYQNHVESTQTSSLNVFKQDNVAAENLVKSYANFIAPSTNILGGPTAGGTGNSGNNTKIILDALPDTYDYPALITSIQALISLPGITIQSISGNDEGSGTGAASQSAASVPVAGDTTAVPMAFSFSVLGPYTEDQLVLSALQASIRPIQVESIDFTGTDSALIMTVTAESYYQPSVGLTTSTETVQ